MEYLSDANKPHFNVWLTLYDIDTDPNGDATFYEFAPSIKSPAAPLYYAALCGFHDLVEHLITKHPQDVNADGGYYVRSLVAALEGEHFQTADLLRHNGADLMSGLSGNFEVVRISIEYDLAYINARDEKWETPLDWASRGHNFKDGSTEHGAVINVQDQIGFTPLHTASGYGALEVVRLLLEHGADVEAKGTDGKTALQVAADRGHDEVVNFCENMAPSRNTL
ncbi:ankyrin repeat-containing domain protein [Russula aff. rugulosa BPL654]|nr:ankyrin repeat-containing domain protein [Russula aff. rugulosa BPL654]